MYLAVGIGFLMLFLIVSALCLEVIGMAILPTLGVSICVVVGAGLISLILWNMSGNVDKTT